MKLRVRASINPNDPSVDSMKFLSKDGKTKLNYDEWFDEIGKDIEREFEKENKK
jgi:hypothetical protein